MAAYVNESIRKILTAATHLWVTHWWCESQKLPTEAVFWVYPVNLEWGNDVLKGKRIRITLEVEDH